MNSAVCPTCGATLTDGRCAKCDSAVKSSEIRRSFVKPVSYVAPTVPPSPVTERQRTWQTPTMQDAITLRKAHERGKRKTRLLTLLILLLIAVAGYEIYEFFVRQALSFSGYYWNEKLYFAF